MAKLISNTYLCFFNQRGGGIMPSEFTKKNVAANIAGLTERTVHYYTDKGLVIPDIDNPEGRGTTRKYSAENHVDFVLIRSLVNYGLNLETIKRIMNHIRSSTIRRWYSRQDGSKFFLSIGDPNTENMKTYIQAADDPERVRNFISKMTGKDPMEIELSPNQKDFTIVPLDFKTHKSYIVIDLSDIAAKYSHLF